MWFRSSLTIHKAYLQPSSATPPHVTLSNRLWALARHANGSLWLVSPDGESNRVCVCCSEGPSAFGPEGDSVLRQRDDRVLGSCCHRCCVLPHQMDSSGGRSPEAGVLLFPPFSTTARGTSRGSRSSRCAQLTLDGESERALLEGVQDDSEYQISLSALYGDGAQSEAVAIRYSTSGSLLRTHSSCSARHSQALHNVHSGVRKVLEYLLIVPDEYRFFTSKFLLMNVWGSLLTLCTETRFYVSFL